MGEGPKPIWRNAQTGVMNRGMAKIAFIGLGVMGGAMARLSAPVRDAGGVVYVQARSAGVADQLDLHRRVIEARLREVLGTHGRTFVLVTGRCA